MQKDSYGFVQKKFSRFHFKLEIIHTFAKFEVFRIVICAGQFTRYFIPSNVSCCASIQPVTIFIRNFSHSKLCSQIERCKIPRIRYEHERYRHYFVAFGRIN